MKFKRIEESNEGGGLVGYVSVAPAELIRVFGKPDGFCGKVSGNYLFENVDCTDRVIFSLYDWKATSLYYPKYPEPEQFWSSEQPYDFHIGGRTEPKLFTTWLLTQVNGSKLETVGAPLTSGHCL